MIQILEAGMLGHLQDPRSWAILAGHRPRADNLEDIGRRVVRSERRRSRKRFKRQRGGESGHGHSSRCRHVLETTHGDGSMGWGPKGVENEKMR